MAQSDTSPMNYSQALARLIEGNRRYVAMRQQYPRQTLAHRQILLEGQRPFAAVLSCSDSRVPSELIFDQGLGDLFVVRIAGHVPSPLVLGSLEFAVHSLEVPLVMVVGHSQCGAVSAVIKGETMPGHIHRLTEVLQPAVDAVRTLPGDLLDNAIRESSRMTVGYLLEQSPILRQAVDEDRIKVVPAYYSLKDGSVEVLP